MHIAHLATLAVAMVDDVCGDAAVWFKLASIANRGSRWNFVAIMSTSRDIRMSRLEAAILDFWLPVTSDIIPNSTVGYLAPKNIRVAVGILLLSCLQVEIYVFPDWRPLSWISDFRLCRTVFPIVPLGSLPVEVCGSPRSTFFKSHYSARIFEFWIYNGVIDGSREVAGSSLTAPYSTASHYSTAWLMGVAGSRRRPASRAMMDSERRSTDYSTASHDAW